MNMADFFSMGGRGFYVWSSFGAVAVALVIEMMLVKKRSSAAAQLKKTVAETQKMKAPE